MVARISFAPRTVNHIIKNIRRLVNWAMDKGGMQIPNDKNLAKKVQLYTESPKRNCPQMPPLLMQ